MVTQRFKDDEGWRLHGYVVPMVIPQAEALPWGTIADLRHDRNMTQFRSVLREVEDEATTGAAGGHIEAAAHHAYERHLADATGKAGRTRPHQADRHRARRRRRCRVRHIWHHWPIGILAGAVLGSCSPRS